MCDYCSSAADADAEDRAYSYRDGWEAGHKAATEERYALQGGAWLGDLLCKAREEGFHEGFQEREGYVQRAANRAADDAYREGLQKGRELAGPALDAARAEGVEEGRRLALEELGVERIEYVSRGYRGLRVSAERLRERLEAARGQGYREGNAASVEVLRAAQEAAWDAAVAELATRADANPYRLAGGTE